MGLVLLGAALGLLVSGLWLHARREPPSRAASPFTLGANIQPEVETAEHAATADPRGASRH